MLEETIKGLRKNLEEAPKKLSTFSEEKFSFKASPNKWSKKEILGHLCDSAVNNYSRFIRGQYEGDPIDARSYQQNEWVALNDYKEATAKDLISLWTSLNKQIVHIISRVPQSKLKVKCNLDGKVVELGYIIDDYLVHMNHHLDEILK